MPESEGIILEKMEVKPGIGSEVLEDAILTDEMDEE